MFIRTKSDFTASNKSFLYFYTLVSGRVILWRSNHTHCAFMPLCELPLSSPYKTCKAANHKMGIFTTQHLPSLPTLSRHILQPTLPLSLLRHPQLLSFLRPSIPFPPPPHALINRRPRHPTLHQLHRHAQILHIPVPTLVVEEQHFFVADPATLVDGFEVIGFAAGIHLQIVEHGDSGGRGCGL